MRMTTSSYHHHHTADHGEEEGDVDVEDVVEGEGEDLSSDKVFGGRGLFCWLLSTNKNRSF